MMRMRIAFLCAALLTAGLVKVAASLPTQSQTVSNPSQDENIDPRQYPVANYGASDASDPKERNARRAKSARHNSTGDINPKQLILTENSPPELFALPDSHVTAATAIPAAESDIAVLGEIVQARAYLSEDRTNIYSEFTVRVQEVLKNTSTGTLFPGASITAERPGGALRFPSGKTLLRGSLGRNMPRVGRRYVLFLRHDDGESFNIITGYELREGRVFPLDHAAVGQGKSKQFANYERYSGADETMFLTEVREIFARSDKN